MLADMVCSAHKYIGNIYNWKQLSGKINKWLQVNHYIFVFMDFISMVYLPNAVDLQSRKFWEEL